MEEERGTVADSVFAYLEENGPSSLSQIARGMRRDAGNLVSPLKVLREKGKVSRDPAKVWYVVDEENPPSADPPTPEDNSPPPAPKNGDPIEAAIRLLKTQGNTHKKMQRIRKLLTDALAIIDSVEPDQ